MKTSNIILSIIAGSATFFILAGAIHLRVTGLSKERGTASASVTTPLEPFRYLVVREAVNLTVTASQQNQFFVISGKNDPPPIIEFIQRGDTLIISRIAHGDEGRILEVTLESTAGSIQYINAKNSMFGLRNYPLDKLVVDLEKTHFSLYGDHSSDIRYKSFRVNASYQSTVNADRVVLDTADLQLDHSEAYFDNVNRLRARLQNKSKLNSGNASDVQYQKDETSKVY
jgi:hypothetical protein